MSTIEELKENGGTPLSNGPDKEDKISNGGGDSKVCLENGDTLPMEEVKVNGCDEPSAPAESGENSADGDGTTVVNGDTDVQMDESNTCDPDATLTDEEKMEVEESVSSSVENGEAATTNGTSADTSTGDKLRDATEDMVVETELSNNNATEEVKEGAENSSSDTTGEVEKASGDATEEVKDQTGKSSSDTLDNVELQAEKSTSIATKEVTQQAPKSSNTSPPKNNLPTSGTAIPTVTLQGVSILNKEKTTPDLPKITSVISLSKLMPQAATATTSMKAAQTQAKGTQKKTVRSSLIPDDMRPMAHQLCTLGLDLVKQHAYKDLIKVNTRRQNQNKLSEVEVKQLEKMRDNSNYLVEKNKAFIHEMLKCDFPDCGFQTESYNVFEWHREFPHEILASDKVSGYQCTFCRKFETYSMREVFSHIENEHRRKGRWFVQKPSFSCPNCPFECSTKFTYNKHRKRCDIIFRLKKNLEPTPQDCDIPQRKPKTQSVKPAPTRVAPAQPKPIVRPAAVAPRPALSSYSPLVQQVVNQVTANHAQRFPQKPVTGITPSAAPQTFTIGGQVYALLQNSGQLILQPALTGKSLVPAMPVQSIRSMATTIAQPTVTTLKPVAPMKKANVGASKPGPASKRDELAKAHYEVCEICGGYVKDRDSLRIHFYWAHKVEIPKWIFDKRQPQVKCTACTSKFYTKDGLQRHKDTVHLNLKCYLCGQQQNNILNHMSFVHKLTLESSFIVKRCIICGATANSADELKWHMKLTHKKVMAGLNLTLFGEAGKSGKPAAPVPTGLFCNTMPDAEADKKGGGKKKYTPVCSICNIPFPSLNAFTAHCNERHIFKCHRCGDKWSSADLRRKHLQVVHKNDLDDCQLCGKPFPIGQPFNRHVELIHLKKCSIKLDRLTPEKFNHYMERLRLLGLELQKKKADLEKNAPVIVLDDSEEEEPTAPSKTSKKRSRSPDPSSDTSEEVIRVTKSRRLSSKQEANKAVIDITNTPTKESGVSEKVDDQIPEKTKEDSDSEKVDDQNLEKSEENGDSEMVDDQNPEKNYKSGDSEMVDDQNPENNPAREVIDMDGEEIVVERAVSEDDGDKIET